MIPQFDLFNAFLSKYSKEIDRDVFSQRLIDRQQSLIERLCFLNRTALGLEQEKKISRWIM